MRVPCLVPFCRRTADSLKVAPDLEWICGKHWRLVPAATKRAYRKIRRLTNRAFTEGRLTVAMMNLEGRRWDRCRVAAIEAAAGITA